MNNLRKDFEFALQHPEEFASKNGGSKSPMLRYVAALNPEVSKKEFVEAAEQFGFNATTAGIQFKASRKFDIENNELLFDEDGRII